MFMLHSQLGTIMCAPVAPQVLAEFQSNNCLYTALLVSVWELGEVVGPLLIAPLSELYGRLWVYNIANVLFVLCGVGGALSKTIHMLIAFRFLSGLSVASIILNPGIVGDLFVKEQRGHAMSIVSLAMMTGPIMGPIVGSYLGQKAGWRWTFWLPTILCGAFEGFFVIFYRETYKVEILKRRVHRLQKATGNEKLRSKYDHKKSPSRIFREAIFRQLGILLFSPIVLLLSLYVSVVYGYLYLIITTLTEVFEAQYRFSPSSVGLVFLGLGVYSESHYLASFS